MAECVKYIIRFLPISIMSIEVIETPIFGVVQRYCNIGNDAEHHHTA